ncbi:MAG: hypothetical protein CML24_13025 [Rhizobiales bacterium]|nr:hypothetical protein [Hyphomicrobiales bacterium]
MGAASSIDVDGVLMAPGVRRGSGGWGTLATTFEPFKTTKLSLVIPGFIPGIQLEVGAARLKGRGVGNR